MSAALTQIGLTPNRVRDLMARFTKPPPPRTELRAVKLRRSKFDWSQADWSLPNTAIARRLGCSAALVLLNRRARVGVL